ncbi:putative membrane protein YphA (DoxX/SURF4 family) [Paenibacillus sp. V4I7]|nr:hypothetical protein [Paenibacillus sp. V4I7]MDQ0897751.1 putative membrane protein YphA (DoxX/SURF4 family) [Paenibacillus sp. V4I7]
MVSNWELVIWKVLGGIALVVPGFPRLKEWVHAGIDYGDSWESML